ncbi:MAG: hypothetical protein ACYDD2_06925 [Candidatus Acidiferrales bacterium]
MVWDVLVGVGIGASQLIITLYAVDISVKEHRKRNAVVIGLLGLVGIGLTLFATIRNGVAQKRLEAQIRVITQNTQLSVHGRIAFDIPGQIITMPLLPFKKSEVPALNIGFHNAGKVPITGDVLSAALVVVPTESVDKAFQEYQSRITQRASGGTLVPGDPMAFYTVVGEPLKSNDIPKLEDGTEALCVIGAIRWKDATGTYETDIARCYVAETKGVFQWHILAEDNREVPVH